MRLVKLVTQDQLALQDLEEILVPLVARVTQALLVQGVTQVQLGQLAQVDQLELLV